MTKMKKSIKKNSKDHLSEDDYLYPPAQHEQCEHRWFLAKSIENFMTDTLYATFICDKCGKIKHIEGKE